MSAVVPPEAPSGRALWTALGGVRGVVESALPELAFLVVFAVTKSTWASVVVPVVIGLVFVVIRLVQRQTVLPAIGGLLLLVVSAAAALLTGDATNNFVPGFVINAVFLAVILVSLVARWPLVGLVFGVITGKGGQWRSDARLRRGATAASWVWVGLFAARLLIELPLYFSGLTEALAVARLLTGVPLYAIALWFTWLLLRSPKGAEPDAPGESGAPLAERS